MYAKSNQKLTDMPEHFYKPKGSSKIYVRLTAPTEIRHLVKDMEYRKSTGHAELRRAKPIGMALIAEKLREWDSIARQVVDVDWTPTILTSGLIEQICSRRLYSWLMSDDEERLGTEGLDDDTLLEIENFSKLTDVAMRSVLAQGAASPRWSEAVATVLEWSQTLGYGLELTDPLFPKLVREFAKVEKEAQARITLRNQGDDAQTPELPSNVGKTLSDVTEVFRAHKATKCDSKHLSTTVNVWKLFIGHCGDITLDSVMPAHIYEFLDARMHAEVKPWSEARAKTFGKRTLSDIFGLARTKGLMKSANPVAGLEALPSLSKEEEASRKNPRFAFNSEQLNTIFSSQWYDPKNCPAIRGKMRTDLGARYWVPLIGLFHGNRVREAVQLIASDFFFEDELFVLSYRKEIDAPSEVIEAPENNREHSNSGLTEVEFKKLRRLKNISTNRKVPVHPKLVELGIVEFIAMRRKDGGDSALLFPSSVPNRGGTSPKLGRSYEQAFLRYVRDKLKFGNGFGNHSLRHQLENRIRAAQARDGAWPAGLGQQYSGRKKSRPVDRGVLSDEGSEGAYGDGYKPSSMLSYIQSINFSDIRLPAPFELWTRA